MLSKIIQFLINIIHKFYKFIRVEIIYWIFTGVLVLIYIFFKPNINKTLTDLIGPAITFIPIYAISLHNCEIKKNRELFLDILVEVVVHIVFFATVFIAYSLLYLYGILPYEECYLISAVSFLLLSYFILCLFTLLAVFFLPDLFQFVLWVFLINFFL